MKHLEIEFKNSTVRLIQGDIITMDTDAIVNSANSSLMGGSGVDGAIHRAGGTAILEECKQIITRQGRLPTGKAVITTGGNLPAKWVIHTVGPKWIVGLNNEAELLSSAYLESLKLAEHYQLRSISFPSISTGIYHYPLDQAAEIALSTVISFLESEAVSVEKVVFVLFNDQTYEAYLSILKRKLGQHVS